MGAQIIRQSITLLLAVFLAGCAAQASKTDSTAPVQAYGPQYKVSVFIRGLDDSLVTSLIDAIMDEPSCIQLRVVERSDLYAELSCATHEGAGIVANAIQSTAQQRGLDLYVSHAGDHVLLRSMK